MDLLHLLMQNVFPMQGACLLPAAGHPSLDMIAVSREQSSLQGLLANHSFVSLVKNTALLSASLLDPYSFCCLPPAARILPAVWNHLDSSSVRDREFVNKLGLPLLGQSTKYGRGLGVGVRRGMSVCLSVLQDRVISLLASWLFFPMTFQWMSQ